MKKYNVIIVYDDICEKILMCLRTKEPYKNKFNLVGGKVEENENYFDAAYRELFEETGIDKEKIELKNLMNIDYNMSNMQLQIYVGKLKEKVNLVEELNKLYWVDINENFFDFNKYAGEGNIGHMLEQVKIYKDVLLEK